VFSKLLVANRGEIACRVIRACRALGVRTVAVYSEADRDAVHVRMADEAHAIGPPPPRESYLVGERILEVAARCGAEAIHPGYGFLSENAEFRKTCEAAGVAFVGPPAEAMRLMGSKTLARQTMIAAGVPIVPGTAEPIDRTEEAIAIAHRIGFPVMLKAAAGGGGKGMRLVRAEGELRAAFEGARREALGAFGDGALYLEKAIVEPRHIEVQVLADQHGHAVAIGDRECSVQRRHQKVVEEAPAPRLAADTRRRMGEMAVAAARAVGYQNAGTIECLVDAEEHFYFLEMNTRLQVEHCVTEEAYGIDLVEAQLRVAFGEPLWFSDGDLVPRRHAIELRVYAEDPYQNDLPSPGRLEVYRPPKGPGIRVDDGVEEGSEISSLYDPLIAKLVASAPDREGAIRRARAALREYEIAGIATNLPVLERVLAAPAFVEGRYTTALLGELGPPVPPVLDPETEATARALAALACQRGVGRESLAPSNGEAPSVWALTGVREQHERRLR
jgi:acetyl-CoA carboxylase biotin carboxylase subunit